jgi:hypothetical protein
MGAHRLGEHLQNIRTGSRLGGAPSAFGYYDQYLLWRTVLDLYDQEKLDASYEIAKTLGEGRDGRGGVTVRLIQAERETEVRGETIPVNDLVSLQYIPEELEESIHEIRDAIRESIAQEQTRFKWELKDKVKISFLAGEFDEWWAPNRYGYCAEKVDMYKICLPYRLSGNASDCARVFKHEFAHVISLSTSKSRVSRWVSEGFSVLAEERHSRRAWEIFMSNPRAWLSPKNLEMQFGPGLELDSAAKSLAYEQAGFIVRFLAQKHGDASLVGFFEDFADESFMRNLKLSLTSKTRTADALKHVYGVDETELFAEVRKGLARYAA